MNALVTGAAGFLGGALSRALSMRGVATRGVARTADTVRPHPLIDWRIADLDSPIDWDVLLNGVDTVYHLAWSTIPASAAFDPAHDLKLNVGSLIALLEAVRRRGGVRLVFASSGGTVYGRSSRLPIREDDPTRPISAYGVAKLAAEAYLDFYRETHGLDAVSLRISNPYGPEQDLAKGLGVMTHFVRAALANEPLVLFGEGLTVRDFIHVDDVADAMVRAGERRGVAGPINIGTGVGHSLHDVISAIAARVVHPLTIVRRQGRAFDVPACVLDISRARERLDWAPRVSFEDGLDRLVGELAAR